MKKDVAIAYVAAEASVEHYPIVDLEGSKARMVAFDEGGRSTRAV